MNPSLFFLIKQEASGPDNSWEGKPTTFSQKVADHDHSFTYNIVRLLDSIADVAEKDNSEKFVSLSNRINFNHYYTEYLSSSR